MSCNQALAFEHFALYMLQYWPTSIMQDIIYATQGVDYQLQIEPVNCHLHSMSQ